MRFKSFIQNEFIGGEKADVSDPSAYPDMSVQSKLVTNDGSSKRRPDTYDGKISPEKLFNFRSPADKKATKERRSQWIDTLSRRSGRFVTIPPDIIY